jgi:hypothetical protein
MIWLLAIQRDLLGELGIIMNFNDHTVIWALGILTLFQGKTETQDFIISRGPDWDNVYITANEPQTVRNEYSRATKILDAEYEQTSASLDDVIKTCENLHLEEQHQLKILLQNYEHLFDGTLGEFNMEQLSISLQLMDPNCKPIHAHAYTVPRSVEQQLQQIKKIVTLVSIGVLEEDYSSEWSSLFPSFAIPKKKGNERIRVVTDFRKNSTQLIVER